MEKLFSIILPTDFQFGNPAHLAVAYPADGAASSTWNISVPKPKPTASPILVSLMNSPYHSPTVSSVRNPCRSSTAAYPAWERVTNSIGSEKSENSSQKAGAALYSITSCLPVGSCG